MAYPGEHEHKNYMDYAISENESGRKPKSKGEWRKSKSKPKDTGGGDEPNDPEYEEARSSRGYSG